MDHLWSPWRYQYISSSTEAERPPGCVFCWAAEAPDPKEALVLGRGERVYAILNRYPYTSGHLMIVPYLHVPLLTDLDDETSREMMEMAKTAQTALQDVYRPDGFNIGMNLGRAAGAGVAEHVHLHVLPRWIGDANFTSVIGETRVLPETLETTFERLRPFFTADEPSR